MKRFNLRYNLLVITVLVLFVWAVAADIPFTFKAGDLISADQMNQNFAALNNGKQELIKGTCAAGSSIRVIATDGSVTCEVDDIGTGAGDAGVDAINGMTGAVTLQAGDNITIDDSQQGQIKISSSSAGGSYSADNSSLTLTGTTFSIKDAGVTAGKIALPLALSSASDNGAIFSVTNSGTSDAIGVLGRSGAAFLIAPDFNAGVLGDSKAGNGVVGASESYRGVSGFSVSGTGVYGASKSSIGIYGESESADGVSGVSQSGSGVFGASVSSIGVFGRSSSDSGVSGVSSEGTGVSGLSLTKEGVLGTSSSGIGVKGTSTSNYGIYGESSTTNAVYGVTVGTETNATAIAGTSDNGYAAYFEAGSGAGLATCTFHAGKTDWDCSSDRNLKENFEAVNSTRILEAVVTMPVTTWNMKGSTIRQLGPTAQDFYAAFNLGDSDKSINNTDARGVAFAAIQGLYQLVQEQSQFIQAQEKRIANLETQLTATR
jgi:Chaperone of endosialidase